MKLVIVHGCPLLFMLRRNLAICVDYRALNKRTSKDAYPLPLADEVQDKLDNALFAQRVLETASL